jgi:teichoic acid transport system permease protein
MGDSAQLSAPGRLDAAVGQAPGAVQLPDEPLAKLAERYGLQLSSARPSIPTYLRQLWQRRHFIVTYATARNVSMYTEARLGQLWQVLTPLLNTVVYYIIFGILFQANRGIEHYTAYLVIGVFIFSFTDRSILVGSRVIYTNLSLIRALHFPRACLPLAYVIVELEQLLLSLLVVFAIVLGAPGAGEPLTWYWFLLIPALVLQTMFNVGAALIIARIGATVQDVGQLVPFLMRMWRYFCGVMYSIASLPTSVPTWAKDVLAANPAAVFISLVRFALMQSQRVNAPGAKPYNAALCTSFTKTHTPSLQAYCHPIVGTDQLWLAGVGWGVVTLAIGVVYFWQAETKYGRG